MLIDPVKALNNVVFPLLGLPTKAMVFNLHPLLLRVYHPYLNRYFLGKTLPIASLFPDKAIITVLSIFDHTESSPGI